VTAPIDMVAPCPCGRIVSPPAARGKPQPLAYAQCCGPYIDQFDTYPAPDAEALMRSRYTAFVPGMSANSAGQLSGHQVARTWLQCPSAKAV
jgi:uncharacterized protein YchJ